jgi:1-acyl-sn-glycerol-3-phosphate acyltransferase
VLATALMPLMLFPSRWMQAGVRLWGVIGWHMARWILGIRTEVRGTEFMPSGAALVAGKHLSMYDTCAPFLFLPKVAFVLKKELASIPLFGWCCVKAKMIVVDRDGGSSALKKMVADAKDRFAANRQVLIFPEGTRAKVGQPVDYKPGIALLYRELDMPCHLMATNSGAHWPNKGLLKTPGTVVFEFLPPIPAGLKRGEFMRELQERLETASNRLLAE